MADVHPTAVVHEGATIGVGVVVEPYAVVGDGVVVGEGGRIGPHAVLIGPTRLGKGVEIGAHAVVGGDPQDLGHDRSVPTTLEIGDGVIVREQATIHRGSSRGTGRTWLGDGVYVMAGAHVGHDCEVGPGVTLTQGSVLGGHVAVGAGAVIGGLAAVHQRVRIGRLAMVAGGAAVTQDVLPFVVVQGDRARVVGPNSVGLRRAGWGPEARAAVSRALQALYVSGLPRGAALDALREMALPEIDEWVVFITETHRGLCGLRAEGAP